jgi:hypothetical protein
MENFAVMCEGQKKEDKIMLYGFCRILYPVDILMNSSELTSRLLSSLCPFVLVWLLKKSFPEKKCCVIG